MSDSDRHISICANRLALALAAHGWVLATAESCTGGWIAKVLTDQPGSSAWFEYGYVSYGNAAKSVMLGVDAGLIARHGAVSREVAEAMAGGARSASGAEVALAVTGIAGPGGGSTDKPVGTVWLAWAGPGDIIASERRHFDGDRSAVRRASVAAALEGMLGRLPAA